MAAAGRKQFGELNAPRRFFPIRILRIHFPLQKKRLSLITTSQTSTDSNDIHNDGPLSGSFHGTSNAQFSPQNTMRYVDGAASDDQKSLSFERNFNRSTSSGGDEKIARKEITRTQALDRSNDAVYSATTNVVKAIMSLSQGVEKAAAIEYLDLVRNVGIELRALLSSVDTLASIFPPQAHK